MKNLKTYSNRVFIATSLDGYIADKEGNIDWLESIPNPDQLDLGYNDFISGIDALVMGRHTFETVCGFDIDWPYSVPVFVLSNSLEEIPAAFSEHAQLVQGSLEAVLGGIRNQGFHQLYIDGGSTIQGFLKADLIDELIITTIPVLLGGGVPLFTELSQRLSFELMDSRTYLGAMVQTHYRRKR